MDKISVHPSVSHEKISVWSWETTEINVKKKLNIRCSTSVTEKENMQI